MQTKAGNGWPPAPYAGFIDVEASGIHPDSYPIKLAICSLEGNAAFETLIMPASYWEHWCHDAQDLHGIDQGSLFLHGLDTREVALGLNEQFGGKILLCDSNQDIFWIDVLFEAAGFDSHFSIVNVHNILHPEFQEAFLKAFPAAKAHRPMDDAIALRNAWYACGAGNILDEIGCGN